MSRSRSQKPAAGQREARALHAFFLRKAVTVNVKREMGATIQSVTS